MFTPRPAHWALLLLAGLSLPGRAAADPLRHEMAAAAAEIRDRLEGVPADKRSVTLARITCPTSRSVTGGARIRLLLAEELGQQGVAVKEDAPVGVSGTLRLAPGNQPAAQIVLNLEDGEGKPLGEPIDRQVFGEKELIELFGPSGVVPPNGKRVRGLQEILRSSTVVIKDNKVMPVADSKVMVELLVSDKPLSNEAAFKKAAAVVEVRDGRAFVKDVKRDQFLTVRVTNLTEGDVAVNLTIDGMSSFTFAPPSDKFGPLRDKDGHPLSRPLLISKGNVLLITDWYRGDEAEAEPFTPVRYSKRVPGPLKWMVPGNIMTFTVTFRKAVKETAPLPKAKTVARTLPLLPVSEVVSIRCIRGED